MNKFEKAHAGKVKRRIQIINGEEYLKVSALERFLKASYNKPDEEVHKEFNSGWDCCINNISGEFDLMIGSGNGKITPEFIEACGRKHREEKKNAKKKNTN